MNNAGLILETTKIIEENLTKPLSMTELSKRVGYSQYHFIRLFSGVVGCSPGEYISSRRLSRAAYDILDRDIKIIDIAYRYQFSSPEAFSRAFKKYSGYSPVKFRKLDDNTNLILELKWASPHHQKTTSLSYEELNIEPEIIELDEMLLAGKTVDVNRDYSLIGQLWSSFFKFSLPSSIKNPITYAQLSFWNSENSEKYIMASVVVHKMDDLNTFVYKKVPKAKYLRFPHIGECHTVINTYNWLFSSWLPKKSYKLKLPYSMEMYPPKGSSEAEKGISAWILLPIE